MYRHNEKQQRIEDFVLPFAGKLRGNNRWVVLSKKIPWDLVEGEYSRNFTRRMGAPAHSARMAFGALLIKEKLGLSDEETVEQIMENPYLQYFIGLGSYIQEKPFDPSMMVHFRKRFPEDVLARINEVIVLNEMSAKEKDTGSDKDDNPPEIPSETLSGIDQPEAQETGSQPRNQGKLLMDATCAPADITYPNDLKLLNDARQKSERIIDVLHKAGNPGRKKPRTYRKQARKHYLSIARRKRVPARMIRKAIRKQLGYLKRDLEHINILSADVSLACLSRIQYSWLLVIHEVYRQQKLMYDIHSHRIDGRIVSISQPHVRPIKRGKAAAKTEFGAKISISVIDGYTFIDRLSWDNYNESGDLIKALENYRKRFGYYPESVHVDQIYRTRKNREYCKEHCIRLSGPKLGRPSKEISADEKYLMRQDELDRIPVEGKFGQAKRRFGLNRIMAKLASTSATVISLTILITNLEKVLKSVFCCLSLVSVCPISRDIQGRSRRIALYGIIYYFFNFLSPRSSSMTSRFAYEF